MIHRVTWLAAAVLTPLYVSAQPKLTAAEILQRVHENYSNPSEFYFSWTTTATIVFPSGAVQTSAVRNRAARKGERYLWSQLEPEAPKASLSWIDDGTAMWTYYPGRRQLVKQALDDQLLAVLKLTIQRSLGAFEEISGDAHSGHAELLRPAEITAGGKRRACYVVRVDMPNQDSVNTLWIDASKFVIWREEETHPGSQDRSVLEWEEAIVNEAIPAAVFQPPRAAQ